MGREMNGHFFMPSHLIEDPFSYTAFAMFFGLGSGNALGPEIQLEAARRSFRAASGTATPGSGSACS